MSTSLSPSTSGGSKWAWHDGRQADVLQIGGVAAYDMPEHNTSLKIKALTAVLASNTPTSWGVVAGWIKKF